MEPLKWPICGRDLKYLLFFSHMHQNLLSKRMHAGEQNCGWNRNLVHDLGLDRPGFESQVYLFDDLDQFP